MSKPPTSADIVLDALLAVTGDRVEPMKREVKAALLELILSKMPEKTNGTPLNITVSATALLGVDPHVVKVAQGEGWDMALNRVVAAVREVLDEQVR